MKESGSGDFQSSMMSHNGNKPAKSKIKYSLKKCISSPKIKEDYSTLIPSIGDSKEQE